MSTDTLGRLDLVDLREVWTSESRSFTPWLASEEGLALLGETLNIHLELEAQEQSIGPFRADILCKDKTGDLVLIENQLERTDHKHLGQLLTYASGRQAVTIVWIAKQFSDEHQAALDWLNEITDDRFRFFGLKIELWRIEESRVAPKFHIVSEPNEWSRSLKQATNATDKAGRGLLYLDYWTKFQDILNKTAGPVAGNKKPQAQNSMTYPIGRSTIELEAKMPAEKDAKIRAALYIYRDAKAYMSLFGRQKDEIEREIGYSLEYEPVPGSKHSRISVYLNDVNVKDQEDWEHQHKWLAEKLNDLHRVFANRISEIDPRDWNEDEIDENL